MARGARTPGGAETTSRVPGSVCASASAGLFTVCPRGPVCEAVGAQASPKAGACTRPALARPAPPGCSALLLAPRPRLSVLGRPGSSCSRAGQPSSEAARLRGRWVAAAWEGLVGQEASSSSQPVGLGRGLQGPCPAAPSHRRLGGLRPRLFEATLGEGLLGAARGGWGPRPVLPPLTGGRALVSAAPGAAHAASEHLQREHQRLPWDRRVWAGQRQLFLVGADGVAAAALGADLIGAHVGAGKGP